MAYSIAYFLVLKFLLCFIVTCIFYGLICNWLRGEFMVLKIGMLKELKKGLILIFVPIRV